MMTPAEVIEIYELSEHPEGGHYRQTWIDETAQGRPHGTAIYFLLTEGQTSHWHHVDAVEIWHFYAGAPLILSTSAADTGPVTDTIMSANLKAGHSPQVIVPKYHWQSARSTGEYSFVGCTVSPAFDFAGFTLADSDFDIPR